MALWELAWPIFVGTFLALACMLALMGKARKMLKGPRKLIAWINAETSPRRHHARHYVRRRRHHEWRAASTHADSATREESTKPVLLRSLRKVMKRPITKVIAVPTPAPQKCGSAH